MGPGCRCPGGPGFDPGDPPGLGEGPSRAANSTDRAWPAVRCRGTQQDSPAPSAGVCAKAHLTSSPPAERPVSGGAAVDAVQARLCPLHMQMCRTATPHQRPASETNQRHSSTRISFLQTKQRPLHFLHRGMVQGSPGRWPREGPGWRSQGGACSALRPSWPPGPGRRGCLRTQGGWRWEWKVPVLRS